MDPPRPEINILSKGQNGITTVMITGDHKNTAFCIKELGIAETIQQMITGLEINEMSEEVFSEKIMQYQVFARVSPEHR